MSTQTSWLKDNIQKIYTFTGSEGDFGQLFDGFFASSATLNVNHKTLQKDAFKNQLQESANASLVASKNVEWKDVFELAIDETDENAGTIVAGVFVVVRSMKFKIRAAPAQRLEYNCFSAKIINEDGQENKARVVELFLTTADKAAPIHLQGIP